MHKILIGLVAVAVLGVGYYALSPLFKTIVVDDALPESITATDLPSGAEALPPEEKEQFDAEMKAINADEAPQTDEPMPETDEQPDVTFPVVGTAGHPASGHVRVIATPEGSVIRYEDFSTINGPRLHVYLAKSLDANEFVDLGPIKGTQGNINYAVPESVSLEEYPYVMYWCVPFGVLFNYAELR